ncbi:MAG TPA: ATP-dependent protease, partial [Luteimonas sp.]|nr:ATP-dependent protease [Luteimonas sp.]
VAWRASEPPRALQPQHALLGTLLRRIFEKTGETRHEEACFDDAAWIGWRLGELLPLPDAQRQTLLQEDDPHVRLDRLLAMIA